MRSGAAIVRVEREPIRHAAQFGFRRGIGVTEEQLEVRAVFEVGDRRDAGAALDAVREAQDIGEARARVEVSAEQQGGSIPVTAAGDRLGARDELIGLGDSIVLAPPASAMSHSPARIAWHARWSATRDDEHAVSTGTFGPRSPSQYEIRPTIALDVVPSSEYASIAAGSPSVRHWYSLPHRPMKTPVRLPISCRSV